MTRVKTPNGKSYHHGNLRSALLAAAEQELIERGVEEFSLRSVANRAGVSHTAPKHHFGSADGLLTSLSAVGFERFVRTQCDMKEKADTDPVSQLEASGLGYVAFALSNPALFRLMFASNRPKRNAPHLAKASKAAFHLLVEDVTLARKYIGLGSSSNDMAMAAAWATAHGLADLLVSDRLDHISSLNEKIRARVMAKILTNSALIK